MDHAEFATIVLEALSKPADDVPSSDLNVETMRNAGVEIYSTGGEIQFADRDEIDAIFSRTRKAGLVLKNV